ncbi:MAG: phosphatidylserine decarboxylase [Bacteroidales bacterium]|nr:phosphatidylserine decarboxylase [Bacteroidales bacterium]
MTYPLLPYSRLVLDLMKEIPGIYEIPVSLRARAAEVDIKRLESAARAAIRNHPVLSMKFDSSGHHPCLLPDEFHGPYHSVRIYKDGDYVFLSASFNRILGDMTSLVILAEDFSRAYRGLELETDGYVGYLEAYERMKGSQRYASSKKWLQNEFGTLSCPVAPSTDSPSDSTEFKDTGLLYGSIPYSETLLHDEHVTLSGFVSLCTAMAIMDCEGTDEAALTWAYSGRDSIGEQRIFGSLHKDIPFVIRRSDSPSELFRQARQQLRSGIAHSDYPYTLTPPDTAVWNYAVNVVHQPDASEVLSTFPFKIETVENTDSKPQIAYSLLDIELGKVSDGSASMLYRYSAAHYRKESMERFAALVSSNAEWLLGGHHRATRRLEEIISSDKDVSACILHSIQSAAEHCPDLRMNPVRSLDGLYSFLDRFLTSMPWESLGLGEEMSLFRRIDQSTGYFLYLFDQPLEELEGRGYLYPSVQFIPEVAEWIKAFNNEWREYLDSPASWDESCLRSVSSDPLFGLGCGWYESPDNWHCWNDFFSRKLSGPAARPIGEATVTAPADGVLQETWRIADNSCLEVPEGVCMKTASVRSVAELLGDSPYRECFAGGLFVHQMLDFYDYHRFHSPVSGTLLEFRTIDGISGSGGIVVWNPGLGRYEYSNPGEPGFQMLETRGAVVIDAGSLGLVAVVAVGMAQVCSVNWTPGLKAGTEVRKGDELGFFLCGGSDLALLFQKNVNLQVASEPGRHLSMGEDLMDIKLK